MRKMCLKGRKIEDLIINAYIRVLGQSGNNKNV
jgi:hypothetical protein